MKKREDSVVSYLQRRKAEYSNKYASRNDPNAWVEKYVEELTQRIDCEAEDIHLYLKDTSVVFSDRFEVVHGSRRMIALHHQERELIQQGIEVPSLAFEANVSIACGIWYDSFLPSPTDTNCVFVSLQCEQKGISTYLWLLNF